MFGNKKQTIKTMYKSEHVVPTNTAMLVGCWTNNVHKCKKCKSYMYIPYHDRNVCCVCGCTELIHYKEIYQWKNDKWNEYQLPTNYESD